MAYAIEFASVARPEFAKLTPGVRRRLTPAIDALAHNPRPSGAMKLQGTPSSYRIRVGEYRVSYEVQDDRLLVLVVRIAHRREVYRRKP